MLGLLRDVHASRSGIAGLHRLAAWRCNSTVAQSEAPGPNVPLEEYMWTKADWFKQEDLTAQQAAKILRRRLQELGPQRENHLEEVVKRVRTQNDASPMVKALEEFRKQRAARQQHSNLSHKLSRLLIKKLLEAGAAEKASEVLADRNRLGLDFKRLEPYENLVIHFSKQGSLEDCIRVFELLKASDQNVTRRFAHVLVRAMRDNDRPDLVTAYTEEFALNGLSIRPSLVKYIPTRGGAGEGGESAEGAESVEGEGGEGGETADGEGEEDPDREGGESGETPAGEGVELKEGDAGIQPDKLPPGSVPS